MKALIVLGIIVVVAAVIFWASTAPIGYEDKDGFHEGEEP